MRTVGVVLAGGVGARLGLNVPKQMVKVAGKTILEHTVAALNGSSHIDELIVMITPGWSEQTATLLGSRYEKLTRILEGGSTRNETTRRVLDALGDEECKVVLHDAVRPLIDERIIADCVAALDTHQAVDVVIPSADTIVAVDKDDVITSIPDRSTLRRYGETVGLAFQIADDLLDLTADAETMGKATGKDAERGKATLVSRRGQAWAENRLRELVTEAEALLAPFSHRAGILIETAHFIANRRN